MTNLSSLVERQDGCVKCSWLVVPRTAQVAECLRQAAEFGWEDLRAAEKESSKFSRLLIGRSFDDYCTRQDEVRSACQNHDDPKALDYIRDAQQRGSSRVSRAGREALFKANAVGKLL